MKILNSVILLLVAPIALFAQTNSAETSKSSAIPNVKTGVLSDKGDVVMNLPGQETGSGVTSKGQEETISVDFPDEDVRTILRSVADLYDLNLVIPDGLQGRTSVKLRNITWNQVFEVVLDPLGYTYIEDRNIIRVKSIEELTAEPVDTRIFVASYARAEELKSSIEPLVDAAAGGNIQVDVRSNALIVKERPSRMGKIESIIKSLDQPTEQVMIESKFIEVRNRDVKNIGINWASLSDFALTVTGGTAAEALVGTTTGATTSFTRTDDSGTNEVKADAAVLTSEDFEVVLSALDSNTDVELVSNPTVVALNNTKANITIADRFPFPNYAFNAQTGERQIIGFEYIDVGIKLDVTPSVNNAGFINLKVVPEVSNSSGTLEVDGIPIPLVSTRRTESDIVIKDGYTLAIGGLVETEVRADVSKVPLLGSIPYVGRLFRSNTDLNDASNLIIFITAKILDPDGSDYRDVVDPRVMNEMNIITSDLPGYKLPEEDLKVLEEIEKFRLEAEHEKTIKPIQDEVDLLNKAKLKEQKKEEKKNKKSKADQNNKVKLKEEKKAEEKK